MKRFLTTMALAAMLCSVGCATNDSQDESRPALVSVPVTAPSVQLQNCGQPSHGTSGHACGSSTPAADGGGNATNPSARGMTRAQLRALLNHTIGQEILAESNARVTVSESVDNALMRAGSRLRSEDDAMRFARSGSTAIGNLQGGGGSGSDDPPSPRGR